MQTKCVMQRRRSFYSCVQDYQQFLSKPKKGAGGGGGFSSAKKGQVSLSKQEVASTHFKYPDNYSGVFSCLTQSLAVKK